MFLFFFPRYYHYYCLLQNLAETVILRILITATFSIKCD